MEKPILPERIIEASALMQAAPLLARHFPGAHNVLLVCDDNTWLAAGEALRTLLEPHFSVVLHMLGRSAKPTLAAAQTLAAQAGGNDTVLLAVGAGSINDITKYAAQLAGKPYSVVASAASMNGYTSATASLIENDFKHSYAAAPPRAVIADLNVLAAAPRRMMRAGLADTLCRSTVETDMLLSHRLLGTPYPKHLFDKMRPHEPVLIAGATAAREGDHSFLTTLMHALLDSGDAMAEYGSSAVASQGEHMIAHTLELMYGAEIYGVLHGELIALTTITLSRLQQKMLLSVPLLRSLPREEKLFLRCFGKTLCAELSESYHKKVLSQDTIHGLTPTLEGTWQSLKETLAETVLSPTTLERVFKQIGLAILPKDLGFEEERYRNACTYAYLTRERFGFLDLAAMNDKRVA